MLVVIVVWPPQKLLLAWPNLRAHRPDLNPVPGAVVFTNVHTLRDLGEVPQNGTLVENFATLQEVLALSWRLWRGADPRRVALWLGA